jgi:pyrroline-5-carboxylate reductase
MGEKILLAGGGKMGSALLGGWLERGLNASDIIVVDPVEETAKAVADRFGVTTVADASAIAEDFAPTAVVLAVKPQSMDDAAPAYKAFSGGGKGGGKGGGAVFLSIAAGKTIAYFVTMLGAQAAIVRAMPNTPAAVGRGITVACANDFIDAAQRRLCDDLLHAVGDVVWIEDEDLMDAVTAVSGCGPAYVFLLAESMAEAGVQAGLPADLSHQLARVTVAGAGELLHQSDATAAQLRTNVTSPGGATEAALSVLAGEDGWQPLLSKAIAAAAKRSRELAG